MKRKVLSVKQIVALNVWGLAVGILTVWLFAAIRPRHSAGPKTAISAGLAVWALAFALATAVPGQIYVQTTSDAKITAAGPDPTPTTPSVYILKQKDVVTPANIRQYVERIYFLSPCNIYASGAATCTAAADGGQPIPTLKRLEMTVASGAASLATVPLVEGIQNMQLDYGVDTTGDGTPGSPFVTAPALADWPNVMAIQVNLLARSVDPSAGFIDSKKYNLGAAGVVGPFRDAYKRHVYSVLARAVNPSGRKE